jgi:hypothetical protein
MDSKRLTQLVEEFTSITKQTNQFVALVFHLGEETKQLICFRGIYELRQADEVSDDTYELCPSLQEIETYLGSLDSIDAVFIYANGQVGTEWKK